MQPKAKEASRDAEMLEDDEPSRLARLDESGDEAAFVRKEKARCTSHGKAKVDDNAPMVLPGKPDNISPVKTRNGVETMEEKVVPSSSLQSTVLHVGSCHSVRPRPRT